MRPIQRRPPLRSLHERRRGHLSGDALASRLKRYGYEVSRQTGSHLRLTSAFKGSSRHVTVPRHDALKVGTLSAILSDVAVYLELDREDLASQLFGQ
jgi:predicted RNA binding protein YcfA (HicA-like mRNA interferase family)